MKCLKKAFGALTARLVPSRPPIQSSQPPPDLAVTLPCCSETQTVNEVWLNKGLHCQKTWRFFLFFSGESQWGTLVDSCWRATCMSARNCSLVKRLHAAERRLAPFLHVGYRTLAAGFSTFHFLSLSLKIKKMDGYIQTLTGKAPYAAPAGSLPHFFKHKDSEIAEL